MLLSIQQRFILDTLKKLNCVRRQQLHTLVRGSFQQDGFEITQARMDAMLRQLRMGTADVRMNGGLVWLSNAQPDARRLEAVDVIQYGLTGGLAWSLIYSMCGLLLFGLVYSNFIRRSGAQTLPEFLEMRYDGRTRSVVAITSVVGV